MPRALQTVFVKAVQAKDRLAWETEYRCIHENPHTLVEQPTGQHFDCSLVHSHRLKTPKALQIDVLDPEET